MMDQCRYEEAQTQLAIALAGAPNNADVHWSMALAKLTLGDLAGAWPHYPWRAHVPSLGHQRQLDKSQWQGETLHGRTILLHVEQGMGDTLQFVRYAPLVADRGGRVLLLCDRAPLIRLLRSWPGRIERIIAADEPLPEFDVHCSLMSLPAIFQTTLATIPPMTPPLQADATLVATWGAKLDALAISGLRVGIAWAGSPQHRNDRNRSVRLTELAPLAAAKDVTFFSLQKGDASAQGAAPPTGMRLIDLTADLADFADTAALLTHLDLVIAVDTSIVHLAGAMNQPVWVMMPFAPDWRWMLKREDSPWYPSMRLFRQSARGQWDDVIARIAGALKLRTNS
jgi:hypothetical protein